MRTTTRLTGLEKIAGAALRAVLRGTRSLSGLKSKIPGTFNNKAFASRLTDSLPMLPARKDTSVLSHVPVKGVTIPTSRHGATPDQVRAFIAEDLYSPVPHANLANRFNPYRTERFMTNARSDNKIPEVLRRAPSEAPDGGSYVAAAAERRAWQRANGRDVTPAAEALNAERQPIRHNNYDKPTVLDALNRASVRRVPRGINPESIEDIRGVPYAGYETIPKTGWLDWLRYHSGLSPSNGSKQSPYVRAMNTERENIASDALKYRPNTFWQGSPVTLPDLRGIQWASGTLGNAQLYTRVPGMRRNGLLTFFDDSATHAAKPIGNMGRTVDGQARIMFHPDFDLGRVPGTARYAKTPENIKKINDGIELYNGPNSPVSHRHWIGRESEAELENITKVPHNNFFNFNDGNGWVEVTKSPIGSLQFWNKVQQSTGANNATLPHPFFSSLAQDTLRTAR
jgi:hypothetical protein